MNYPLFVSCPKGLEYLLEAELIGLGLNVTRVTPQGVYGDANLETVYHLCLWSRLANRVQLILLNGQAHHEQAIYKLCQQFAWQTVFTADKTFAVSFHGASPQIRNAMYGAQLVKDAIVDHFRQLQQTRPSVDRNQPQILFHAYLKQDTLTVSFDLAGYSLHQRGYRTQAGRAPLKENLAAAMLIRAQWPKLAEAGFALHDPFCGSGTLVIEAAMMAAQIAPGLLRTDQSLVHWVRHHPALWEKIRARALAEVRPTSVQFLGTDEAVRSIAMAKENAERAGVSHLTVFEQRTVSDCQASAAKGLLICNPPYGERLSEAAHLVPIYQQLGQILHARYQGWQAAFLTSNSMLAKATGLRSEKQYALLNGALECKLYCLNTENNQLKNNLSGALSPGAQMFSNRLKKNLNHLQKWAKRNQVTCYRVYDSDLPEYAYAIDLYDNYAVLQEYVPPRSIPAVKAERRSLEVMQVTPSVLGVKPDHLIVKQRKPQKGADQYQKLNQTRRTIIVREGQAKFKVNLYDYLDTGLFLDHRLLRLRFATLKPGTQFLNCFCYTASASVHAALAGALTTNVDLSNTYLQWGQENFKLNHLSLAKHRFIQEDCLSWLKNSKLKFDVIFLDPPSFSNSKRMRASFDIQRDQEVVVNAAMGLLRDDGHLYFSTNFRQFKLSPILSEKYTAQEISEETIDVDFKRNKRIHRCFVFRKQVT